MGNANMLHVNVLNLKIMYSKLCQFISFFNKYILLMFGKKNINNNIYEF